MNKGIVGTHRINCYRTLLDLVLMALMTTFSSCFFQSSEVDNTILPVEVGDKWGYIDKKGKYIVNPQFDDAGFFRNGIAKVETSDGLIGYIDLKGKMIISPQYTEGTHFYEEKAFVIRSGSYPECINAKGEILFSLKAAERAYGFSDGYAKVAVKNQDGNVKYGFVNPKGELVIAAQYELASSFKEGLAAVVLDDKWGFIDKKGNIVINPQFSLVTDFHDGLAMFYNGSSYGYIDKKGNYVINPQFDFARPLSEDLALIQQGDMYGYIDKSGKIIINPQFEGAGDFSNGLATAQLNGKVGFIDKSSQWKIPAQFDASSDFIGDVAFVRLGDKWGLIDEKGKYLVNPQFDFVKYSIAEADGDYVTTEYYDASKSVSQFLQQYKLTGNSFDIFNANTTLQDILDSPEYGDFADCDGDGLDSEDEDNYIVYITDEDGFDYAASYFCYLIGESAYKSSYEDQLQKVSARYRAGNELLIVPESVLFKNQICSRDSYYSSKKYAFSEKVSGVTYAIFTYGGARGKVAAVKEELKRQLSSKTNSSFTAIAKSENYNASLEASFSNKISFAIASNEYAIALMVGFDTYFQEIVKEFSDEDLEDLFDSL